MKLVAFVGPKGSGKDTCAAIARDAGLVQGRIPFAGPLKRICSNVFKIPLENFEHPEKKEEPREYALSVLALNKIIAGMDKYIPMSIGEKIDLANEFHRNHFAKVLTSPRHVLQYVGTELIRAYDENWHCKAAFSEKHLRGIGVTEGDDGNGGDEVYAVTDCRFVNEFTFLNTLHDTTFIYVERPEAEQRLSAATHASELEIRQVRESVPNVIHNAGSLDDLRQCVLHQMGVQ